MTLSITKHKMKNGKIYYDLWDQKRIKGKVVRKYVGYIGTSSNAKQEISAKQFMVYIERLLRIGIIALFGEERIKLKQNRSMGKKKMMTLIDKGINNLISGKLPDNLYEVVALE